MAGMKDGGWMLTDKGYELHPSQRERSQRATRDALAAIEKRQQRYPVCDLCGQRCRKLDGFGLCSKTSGTHTKERAAMRAEGLGA